MAEPGQGFYPYQAVIEGYGNGGFRFAGMSHRGSLLCLPTGMHAWAATNPAEIGLDNLGPVFEAADQIDVLLVGLGKEIAGTFSNNDRLRKAGQVQQDKGTERLKAIRAELEARSHEAKAAGAESAQKSAQKTKEAVR